MPRCCVRVFDRLTHRYRKCLNVKKWGQLCSIHARHYIVKIQAAWRGHKTKTKINIYKNLPAELWRIILGFIHQRNNIHKLYKSHAMIYQKKVNDLHLLYRHVDVLCVNTHRYIYQEYAAAEINLQYFNKLLNS
jgi:hypothetical protein